MKNFNRTTRTLAVLSALIVLAASTSNAATDFWNGSVSSGNWNSGASWLSGSPPSSFDSLVFTNQSGALDTANNDFIAGTPFDGIRFDNSAALSTFNLTGNGILLSGNTNNITIGITNATSLAETVSLPLTLDWGYYNFFSPAGSLNINGTLTPNLVGVAVFGPSNVKSTSFTLDGTGLISGLGGAGLIGNTGTGGGFISLATISGGNVSAYAYTGNTVVTAAGAIGATTQAAATNLELTAITAGNYTLNGGTSTTYGSSDTFFNTVLLTESSSVKLVVGSANSGTIVMGTLNAGTGMYVGGFYVPSAQSSQELTVGAGTSSFLTAGPMTGSPVPGEIIFAINGTSTSNEGEVAGTVKDNLSGGKVTLVKTGPGSMYLNVANTYSGGTYVDQGYLQANTATSYGTGPIYIAPLGTIYPNINAGNFANNIFLSPGLGAFSSYGNFRLSQAAVTLSGTLTLQGAPVTIAPGDRLTADSTSGAYTLSGQITGSGTLDLYSDKAGGGFLFDNTGTANNWTGGLIVETTGANQQYTKLGANNQINGNNVIISSGGTSATRLDLNGFNDTIGGLTSAGTAATDQMANESGTASTLTISNNANATFGGVVTGSSLNIIKAGTGTQTISGANNYAGSTTVNQGELITTTASTGAGSYAATNGATLGVQVAGAGQQLSMSSLALGNSVSDTSTLLIKTLATGNPSAAPVNITGALTTFGTVNIQLSGSALATGTFPLISYGSETLNGATINLITSSRVSATLTDNNSGLISVTISAIDPSIEWLGGASGNWDINDTGNTIWQGINSLSATYYIEDADGNDAVTFDDNATGTTTANLTTTLTPLAVAVNNTAKTYTFSGTGKITGAAILTKNGSGALTLAESGGDNFSGGISIGANGGSVLLDDAGSSISGGATIGGGATLQIGNNDAGGNLPGTVTDNGALILDRSDAALNVGTAITGSGTLTNSGSGTVTFSTGPNLVAATINNGIVEINGGGGGNGCFSNTIVVNASGELDLNANDSLGYNATLPPVTISGIVKKLNNQAETMGRPITLSGGTLATTLSGVEQFESFGGFIQTAAGTANFINGPGKFGLRTASCYFSNAPNSTLTISCVIETNSNAGGNTAPLNKYGAGTLILNNTNTYTGSTIINAGTLTLTGNGSLSNTVAIIIGGGAAFDVSGLSSAFALGASQTLSNSTSTAVLGGDADASLGTIGLTYASGTPSLSVTNGTLTLASTTVFNVNNTGAVLPHGSYNIISIASAGNVGLVSGTVPSSVAVSGAGVTAGATPSLQISGGALNLVVPDQAPVAASAAYSHPAGQALKIALADLATNWSDPDGDAVSLSSVASPSVNGVMVTNDANYIYYTYTGADTTPDSFTYTVSDGFGGTAVGTVNVTVAGLSGTAPSIGNPGTDPVTHNPTFSGSGIPGYEYGVESETSLSGPWANAGADEASSTVTVRNDGSWSFTNSTPSPGTIFFRLYYPYSATPPN